MNLLLIIAAMTLGQNYEPTLPSASSASAPIMGHHAVTHEGMTITVEGWVDAAGRIKWFPDSPFNVAAVRLAKAKRAASLTETPKPAKAKPLFGVQREFLGFEHNRYAATTAKSRQFVAEATQAPLDGLDSISGKVHLTVIGTDDERKQVIADLKANPSLVALKDAIVVQDYKAGDWAVDPGLGFQPGTPSITIQAGKSAADPKGGAVLYRSASYAGGAEKLAEAIRKANPNYKPSLDPGIGGSSAKCPLGFTPKHYLPIGIAIAAILWILNQKKGSARA